MSPTTCDAAGNFNVVVEFGLQDMVYTNWFYELWWLDDGATSYVREVRIPAYESDVKAFCIDSPPSPTTRYLVQIVNTVDGRFGPTMPGGVDQNNLGTRVFTYDADDVAMTSNDDGAFSPNNAASAFGPAPDDGTTAFCQLGFVPGDMGNGCGVCYYSSGGGTANEIFPAGTDPACGVPPCTPVPCPGLAANTPLT
mmetsp:Transcript_48661/g.117675  ORF Transcript_48661/g.117675 Transcript_48661/m.117675 type:complete len:196 (-) Transcript_48661:675-1262(-)